MVDYFKYDVKEFFMNISHPHLLHRIKFTFTIYRKRTKSNYISVPKYRSQAKNLPPLPGRPPPNQAHKYFVISLDTLYDIIVFALKSAVFELGSIFILQILGLPMGGHFSPSLSIFYLVYDEHHRLRPIRSLITNMFPSAHMVIVRYVDDGVTMMAAKDAHTLRRLRILLMFFLLSFLYEHDLPVSQRRLKILPVFNSHKFLDTNIIIYNDHTRIKLTYHNKNADIFTSSRQNIGRFFDHGAAVPLSHTLAGPITILIRIHDHTSFIIDMLQPISRVIYETHFLLSYPHTRVVSIIQKAARARPSPIWVTVLDLLHKLQ